MLEKKAYRQKMLLKRAAEDADDRGDANQKILTQLVALPEVQNAHTIFCYISTKEEVDTLRFIEQSLAAGKRVCVPLCKSMGVMHPYAITGLDDLQSGKYDIPEPKSHCQQVAEEEIDLVIVPCVCVDRDGYRLGYGGGFYDRWLEKNPVPSIILCRESLVTEKVPLEEHDQRVGILVTDAGVRYFS
jgi:5-formyltetrahydrofolate cyclo-ligase